ncbi:MULTISPECIES: GreA/GreB family elongation factor [unclassified Pseudomonas]|uniref:GreA/GreB family elongation factor n=1 Tax=unclassified Pseudomonas TaxID=196821 RepID=UPI0005BD8481|nr:elongation factor GreAB [Pseudomonas sp. M47T1]
MNKHALRQLIVDRLAEDFDVLQRAAQTAYETATHEENVAENKYDTLGLEASYLATGQARRMEEIRQALSLYQQLALRDYDHPQGIQIGALVALEAENGQVQWLFLGPEAAGLKITLGERLITVITPRSPLGQSLLGKFEDEDISLTVAGVRQVHTVTHIV